MFFSDSVSTIAQTRAQIAVTDDTERPCDKRFRLNVWTMACWSTEWNLSMQLVAVETMSKGEGQILKSLLPFGTSWQMDGALRERAIQEREVFRSWVAELDAPVGQVRVLSELLELMDKREFVEGRAACVTYKAELARRTGLGDSLEDLLKELVMVGLITRDDAADIFEDHRPGVVFRIRHPAVVLTVEAAGPLWMADSWARLPSRDLS